MTGSGCSRRSSGLGHEVIAREIDVRQVGVVTAREQPDVALVGLGLSSDHALELITEIVHEATCPVIALLSARDPAYVHEAAKRGVFAYIVDTHPEELQGAIDITLQRFTEYQNLQGAFGRRALIEQAKGILMARNAIDQEAAFEMLQASSRQNDRKLIDVASAVVDGFLLLPAAKPSEGDLAGRDLAAQRLQRGDEDLREGREGLDRVAQDVERHARRGWPASPAAATRPPRGRARRRRSAARRR